MGKYPWIPRDLFPAVMYACAQIRKTGWFNQSVAVAAKEYGVPAEEIEKHVRARQAAGQRGKKRGPYKYFVLLGFEYEGDRDSGPYVYDKTIRTARVERATSAKNALSRTLVDIFGDGLTFPVAGGFYWEAVDQAFDSRAAAGGFIDKICETHK